MNLLKGLLGTGTRRIVSLSLLGLVVLCAAMMFWLNEEPEPFDPVARAEVRAAKLGHEMAPGYVTTATLIEVMDLLLGKRGGYMNNDVMPPWSLLDNIPNWEVGVVFQARDLARSMRNDFSRSQTQSSEDPDLAIADPQFSFDNGSWLLPSTASTARASAHWKPIWSAWATPMPPTPASTAAPTTCANTWRWLKSGSAASANSSRPAPASNAATPT